MGVRELFGVHHWKAMVSDNDVMIFSGAQTREYCFNRQDRSWIIRDCKPFADYIWDLIEASYEFSPRLNAKQEIVLPDRPDSEGDFEQFCRQYAAAIEEVNRKHSVPAIGYTAETYYVSNKMIDCTSTKLRKPYVDKAHLMGLLHEGFEPRTERDQFISDEIDAYARGDGMLKEVSKEPMFMTPSFQFNRMGITDEDTMWTQMLTEMGRYRGPGRYHFRMSTGYLNLPSFARKLLAQQQKSRIEFQCPAPESNTFSYAKGRKQIMPSLLSLNVFRYALDHYRLGNDFTIWEQKKRFHLDGDESIDDIGTFHFKGLWITQPGEDLPADLVIGSSNFNVRGFRLDTEMQFYFSTQDKNFQRLSLSEWENIRQNCHEDVAKGVRTGLFKRDRDLPAIGFKHQLLYPFVVKLFC